MSTHIEREHVLDVVPIAEYPGSPDHPALASAADATAATDYAVVLAGSGTTLVIEGQAQELRALFTRVVLKLEEAVVADPGVRHEDGTACVRAVIARDCPRHHGYHPAIR